MYQQLMIIGNVGSDPELAYTPQGVARVSFSVAVNEKWGKGENRKETTTWFRVTAWREAAEAVSQYIKKGSKVLVVGKIGARGYINKEGEAAASLDLNATLVKFLDGKEQHDGSVDPGRGRADSNAEDPNEIPF